MIDRLEIVEELHKPVRKNFKRRHVILKGLNDLYQADLCEMIPYAKVNKGFRYILVVINTFSKFVWALPVKRKNGHDVTNAMQKVLSSVKKKSKKFTNRPWEGVLQQGLCSPNEKV